MKIGWRMFLYRCSYIVRVKNHHRCIKKQWKISGGNILLHSGGKQLKMQQFYSNHDDFAKSTHITTAPGLPILFNNNLIFSSVKSR